MQPLVSKIDTGSEEFAANVQFMRDYVAKIRGIEQQIRNSEERYRERATKAGVTQVIFDRGRFMFHGRVKALADAAREGGLSF